MTVENTSYAYGASSPSRLRILMAEDDDFYIKVALKLLSNKNADVFVAKNGLMALEKAKNEPFDMILMDIQMPVMDGITASKEIRKFNNNTPIVVVTSGASSEEKDLFAGLGNSYMLYKPMNPNYFDQIVLRYSLLKALDSLN